MARPNSVKSFLKKVASTWRNVTAMSRHEAQVTPRR